MVYCLPWFAGLVLIFCVLLLVCYFIGKGTEPYFAADNGEYVNILRFLDYLDVDIGDGGKKTASLKRCMEAMFGFMKAEPDLFAREIESYSNMSFIKHNVSM